MKNLLAILLVTLVCLVANPAPAIAEEVWDADEGEVSYEVIYREDRNTIAVWEYSGGKVFIEGLGGVAHDRGSYHGYWVQKEPSLLRCETYREGVDGQPSYYWGRFEITFLDPDIPSRWQAKWGLCDREPAGAANGTPRTS